MTCDYINSLSKFSEKRLSPIDTFYNSSIGSIMHTRNYLRAKLVWEKFIYNSFKLMNNAAFGNITKNVRNYSKIKLITKWTGRYGADDIWPKSLNSKTSIFNENLIDVEPNKTDFC